MARLQLAALGMHRTLALPLPIEAQHHVRSAIDELDAAVRLIEAAALGAVCETESESDS